MVNNLISKIKFILFGSILCLFGEQFHLLSQNFNQDSFAEEISDKVLVTLEVNNTPEVNLEVQVDDVESLKAIELRKEIENRIQRTSRNLLRSKNKHLISKTKKSRNLPHESIKQINEVSDIKDKEFININNNENKLYVKNIFIYDEFLENAQGQFFSNLIAEVAKLKEFKQEIKIDEIKEIEEIKEERNQVILAQVKNEQENKNLQRIPASIEAKDEHDEHKEFKEDLNYQSLIDEGSKEIASIDNTHQILPVVHLDSEIKTTEVKEQLDINEDLEIAKTNLNNSNNENVIQDVQDIDKVDKEETDLVVYDYAKSAATQEKGENEHHKDLSKLAINAVISDNVLSSIKREMSRMDTQADEPVKDQAVIYEDEYKITQSAVKDTEYSQKNRSPEVKSQSSVKKTAEYSLVDSSKGENTQLDQSNEDESNTLVSFTLNKVVFGKGISERLKNFDFRPHFAPFLEIFHDDNQGFINLDLNLLSKHSTLSGTITHGGGRNTMIELPIRHGLNEMEVLLLDEFSLVNFLKENNVSDVGGHVLIKLDSETKDANIDVPFEKLFLLSHEFKVVSEFNQAEYVFFAGVRPGNFVVEFFTFNKTKFRKVAHVQDAEVLYLINAYNPSLDHYVELFEQNLLSLEPARLTYRGDKIISFNSDKKAQVRGQNRYELFNALLGLGEKSYLEFQDYINFSDYHDSIFVGHFPKLNKKLTLPSKDFIELVLKSHELMNLDGVCLIQINLKKDNPIKEFLVDGLSINNSLNVNVSYFDKDGKFYPDPSEITHNIFIIGEAQGVINGSIEYLNGKRDFIQSYCSLNTYLVEEL